MKIANVYDMLYPYRKGGVEKRNWELAHRLAARNHEVHLFGMQFWDGPCLLEREGVYLRGVCKPREIFVDGRRSIGTAIYFASRVLPYLIKEKFDIIDCQNAPYFPCFSAKLGSLLRSRRLIITWHEVWGHYWYEYLGRKGFFGEVVEWMAAHLADGLVSVSERTKINLRNIGVRQEITVIPSGVDTNEISKIEKAKAESDLIYVGRLIREKNVELLIKAVKLLKRDLPGIRCVIVGDGPERQGLNDLAHNLGIDDNVIFTGIVENYSDVISLMKSSKVFVLPSTREGLGLVVIEANACGLPVVTVDHPMNAACDLIKEGNGLICELSPADMAGKIVMGLEKGTNMRKACAENAQKYNWDRICDQVESNYED